jgi:hypothetical protein
MVVTKTPGVNLVFDISCHGLHHESVAHGIEFHVTI